MRKFLFTKPRILTDTAEHRIHTRKWWAILILIVGGLLLAGRAPVPMSLSYTLLFFGHAGMLHGFWEKRDYPMVIVNVVWLGVDGLGFIRWWNI